MATNTEIKSTISTKVRENNGPLSSGRADDIADTLDAVVDAGVTSATFTITAAQLDGDIASTAVEVLAAPGAGKTIIPIAIKLNYSFGATAYDDVDLSFRYNGTTNALFVAQEINGGADEEWVLSNDVGNAAALSATAVNKAIEVIASADPDGVSNGDGSFTGTIIYMVI